MHNFSTATVKAKLQRSFSVSPHFKRRNKVEKKNKDELTKEVDPIYVILKEASNLRARSSASSRRSSGTSRRPSGSSKGSENSLYRKQIEDKQTKNIIKNEAKVSRTYSASPTLFRRRCIKNQTKVAIDSIIEKQKFVSKPLYIDIPQSKSDDKTNNDHEGGILITAEKKQSNDPLPIKIPSNNSPSGSNNSSKSVHFASEIKTKLLSTSETNENSLICPRIINTVNIHHQQKLHLTTK